MTEPSAFNKDILQTIDIEKKSDIFEELNLPPEFAAFCRKNARNIKIVAICIALSLISWVGYDYYSSTQVEKSGAALAVAMQEGSEDLRAEKLTQLIGKYSGSEAALWSLVELGHTDLKAVRFPEAIGRYSEALDGINEESPLAPLLHFLLAQAFEQNKEADKAIDQYQLLTANISFADMGYMALGRIYEQKGETVKARDAYEKIEKDQSGWAKERLATLIPPAKNDK